MLIFGRGMVLGFGSRIRIVAQLIIYYIRELVYRRSLVILVCSTGSIWLIVAISQCRLYDCYPSVTTLFPIPVRPRLLSVLRSPLPKPANTQQYPHPQSKPHAIILH